MKRKKMSLAERRNHGRLSAWRAYHKLLDPELPRATVEAFWNVFRAGYDRGFDHSQKVAKDILTPRSTP